MSDYNVCCAHTIATSGLPVLPAVPPSYAADPDTWPDEWPAVVVAVEHAAHARTVAIAYLKALHEVIDAAKAKAETYDLAMADLATARRRLADVQTEGTAIWRIRCEQAESERDALRKEVAILKEYEWMYKRLCK